MALKIGRRKFISALGGSAVAWPFTARAQSGDRMRRIGVLDGVDDSEGRARRAAFQATLQELGWTDGHNVRFDYRWGEGDISRIPVSYTHLDVYKRQEPKQFVPSRT